MKMDLGYSKSGGRICCNATTLECFMPWAQWHGTSGGYSNHQCKCPLCIEAWRNYINERGYRNAHTARKAANGLAANSTISKPIPRKKEYKPRIMKEAG
jgi:hypothetical protein